MRFRTVPTMAFICVICLFLAPIAVKAGVTIDPMHKDRILIGPDKIFDWVEVNCVSHIVGNDKHSDIPADNFDLVHDYCDYGPILKLTYSPEQMCWFITKKHSRWVFLMDHGLDSADLRLLTTH